MKVDLQENSWITLISIIILTILPCSNTQANDEPGHDVALNNTMQDQATVKYEAKLDLKIQRIIQGAKEYYTLFPRLTNVSPPAETTHQVFSPNRNSSGNENTSNSSRYNTLTDLNQEIQNGKWTISFNADSSMAQDYEFTISGSLVSTDMPPVEILNPRDGAIGLSTHSPLSWKGPSHFDVQHVIAHDIKANTTLGFDTLSPHATTWPELELAAGTNAFTATYNAAGFSGLIISEPEPPESGQKLNAWSTAVSISSRGSSTFVTDVNFLPQQITLQTSTITTEHLNLTFLSQAGANHIIESTTNLLSNHWNTITNFPGYEQTNSITLPNTNTATFYRIQTQ